jgi:protein TonB
VPRRPSQPKSDEPSEPAPPKAAGSARAPRTRRAGAATLTPVPTPEGSAKAASRSRVGRPPRSAVTPTVAPQLIVDNPAPPMVAPLLIPGVDVQPGRRLFTYALGVSIVIHATLLAIRFAPFDLREMIDRGPPLEVALVNAKSKTKPTKADILAQAHLDGGGNTDADRRAKTPLPVLPKEMPTNEIAAAEQQVQELEKRTKNLMSQLQSTPMPTTAPAVQPADKSDLPSSNELMQKTLEAMRLEAQIAKDMDAYQKRPKRRFVGARAEEYRFARYVEDWRLKVERIGNLNYPEAARQMKLYGNLLVTVAIKSDGTIETIEVNRSSGQRILDAAAVKIVEMGAPYAPFPPDIKRDTDILYITRTWTFAPGDSLISQ